MKIFVTILLATSMTLTMADISLTSSDNNVPQSYYPQQQHPIPHQQQQQVQYSNQNIIPNSLTKPSTQYLPQSKNQRQFQQQQQLQYPMPSNFPSTYHLQSAARPARRYRPRIRIPKKMVVTKNFYIHTAPEDTQDEIDEELAALQHQPRKHYNVLFVKTPSQTNKVAALNLARSLKEEKTVVYVLAKKTSAADLQDAIQEYPQPNNKPEVFFVKYSTPEEAANAQRQIQSQYDSLAGPTTISDEGIAPSTSVIGSLDASEEGEGEEGEEEQEHQQQTQQQEPLDNSQELIHTSDHYDESPPPPSDNGYLPPSSNGH